MTLPIHSVDEMTGNRRVEKVKKQPQVGQSAYVVIDTDGSVVWSFTHADKRVTSVWAEHPGRKVARVEVVKIVRKARPVARRKGAK